MEMREKEILSADEQVHDVPQKSTTVPVARQARSRRTLLKWLTTGAVLLVLGANCQPQHHEQEGKLGPVRRQSTATAAAATDTVLVDYQVHQPVLTPEGATLDSGVSNGLAGDVEDACQLLLMDHVFAYSYGEPFIGEAVHRAT